MGSGDPARVILAVLAVADGTPTDAIRGWLRSRGNAEVRALASSQGAFRDLVSRSERYLAGYTPEAVRSRTAHRVVPALSLGLPAAEAALLALIAIDMISSGKDGALLTRAFSVAMGCTQKSITNRADSLAASALLRVAAKQVGVPTRVRLRRTEASMVTDEMTALIEDLGAGTGSRLTELFFAVRSPALSYGDLGYDAWYVSLCEALGIRKATIPASRASRARSRMRDLANTDDLLEAIRVLETSEVIEARDAAEAERAAAAIVRAESATETRARKAAGWAWVDSLDLPKRSAKNTVLTRFLREARESMSLLDIGVHRYAIDVLTDRLRKRSWTDERITIVLDGIFPGRHIARWTAAHGDIPTNDRDALVAWVARVLPADDTIPRTIVAHLGLDDERALRLQDAAIIVKRTAKFTNAHGAVPTEQTALIAWVQAVRASSKDADVLALRRLLVRSGIARTTAQRAFPDSRLTRFHSERGAIPAGDDNAAIVAWVQNDVARAPRRAEATLRDDLAVVGWSDAVIDRAIPFLMEGTGHV